MKRPLVVAGAAAGGLLLLYLLWKLLVATSSATGLLGSGYEADYKLVSLGYDAGFEVTVKGKSAKLAVILTNPNGESSTEIIESERMITNSATVRLPMGHPQAGNYVLTVKTFAPEEVVFKKVVKFSPNRLTVENVTFAFAPWHYTGEHTLEGLEIVLRKDGNLPIEIANISVAVGDMQCQFCAIQSDHIMINRQHTIQVRVNCPANRKIQEEDQRRHGGLPLLVAVFRAGDKYLVKGTVFYGKERGQSVDFEKELAVVSSK